MKKFKKKNPHFEYLHKKWTAKHKEISENLLDKHLRKVAIGSLGGLMLLSTPGINAATPTTLVEHKDEIITGKTDENVILSLELRNILPKEFRNLNEEENSKVEEILTKFLGVPIRASIDNKRLNRTFGMIGAEQHLYRYPGDTLHAHAKTTQDWAMYGSSGIAPHVGAWGYFANSKAEFTEEDEQKERYYLAVQTFLSPGFAERVGEYRDFFKYRKMLVVNPKSGQAVVAVVADAGPAVWTGKHLGGSPEVMHYLGLADGPRKGEVLYFFIDDKDNQVPLGPIMKEGQLYD